MKKETNVQSAEIKLNRLLLSLIQAAPFLKKRGHYKIDNSLVQRQRQIALLFPSWNFSYNALYSVKGFVSPGEARVFHLPFSWKVISHAEKPALFY